MFGIPGSGRDSMGKEWVTLAILAAALLGLLAFRGLIKAGRKMTPPQYAVPDASEDMPKPDPTDPIRRAVLERRRKEMAEPASQQEAGPEDQARVRPIAEEKTIEPWRERSPEEIPLSDALWLRRTELEEEKERGEFLPMLENFTPLEPEPVRAWRQRIMEAVESGAKLSLRSRKVVDASLEGLGLESDSGGQQKLLWGDLSHGEMYALALDVYRAKAVELNPLDVLFLGQLAEIAGQTSDSQKFREEAVAADEKLKELATSPPRVTLDFRILDQFSWAWDDPQNPEPANSLWDDAPSIFHVYRYMRTIGPEALRKSALKDPKYGELLNRPAENRGRAISLIARFVKRFKSMRWTKYDGHVQAGIRDLDFCFIVDTHVRGIYLVSAPQDLRGFTDSDIVSVTGIYVRRWPYLRHGEWRWVPYIAALSVERYELPPIKGLGLAKTLLVIGAVGLFVVIFVLARKDTRQGADVRERLSRLRGGREHIRRKVEEISGNTGASKDEAPGGPAS